MSKSSYTWMEFLIAARFAPFEFFVVPCFPNVVLTMNKWGDYLPRFRGDEDDHLAHHLIKFHEYMLRLGILHEDVLMNMFMHSLEGDARQWYISLPPSRISSLKYFHATFHAYCKFFYLVEFLLEICCNMKFNSVIEYKELILY
jgi:hypothetical protein